VESRHVECHGRLFTHGGSRRRTSNWCSTVPGESRAGARRSQGGVELGLGGPGEWEQLDYLIIDFPRAELVLGGPGGSRAGARRSQGEPSWCSAVPGGSRVGARRSQGESNWCSTVPGRVELGLGGPGGSRAGARRSQGEPSWGSAVPGRAELGLGGPGGAFSASNRCRAPGTPHEAAAQPTLN